MRKNRSGKVRPARVLRIVVISGNHGEGKQNCGLVLNGDCVCSRFTLVCSFKKQIECNKVMLQSVVDF